MDLGRNEKRGGRKRILERLKENLEDFWGAVGVGS